jgi:hypothetical protein
MLILGHRWPDNCKRKYTECRLNAHTNGLMIMETTGLGTEWHP